MKTSRFILSIALMLWGLCALADSPLTSCDFHTAYADHPIVRQALESHEMTPTIMNFLADKNRPVSERAAVVNALGWDFNSTPHARVFLDYLCKKHKAKGEKELARKLDAGTLAVYAYSRAMSNYFNVDEAMELADKAVEKDRTNSFAINMLSALIAAQQYLDSDWAMVYDVVNGVMHNGSLNLDMKQEAIDVIWDYIKIYEEYATNATR